MTQTSQPASAFTETPLSRCEFYKSVCCLPAVVDPRTGRIAMGAGSRCHPRYRTRWWSARGCLQLPACSDRRVRSSSNARNRS